MPLIQFVDFGLPEQERLLPVGTLLGIERVEQGAGLGSIPQIDVGLQEVVADLKADRKSVV